MSAGVLSYGLDFVYSQYWALQPWVWAVQFSSILAGGAFWAGLGAFWVGGAIIRTGVASNLLSGDSAAGA